MKARYGEVATGRKLAAVRGKSQQKYPKPSTDYTDYAEKGRISDIVDNFPRLERRSLLCEGTNIADLAYYFARKLPDNDFHGFGASLIMNEEFMNTTLKGSSIWLCQPSKTSLVAEEK
jgi:hypothetical protein